MKEPRFNKDKDKENLINQEVDLFKDKKVAKFKVGDKNSEGFEVLEVLPDGRMMISREDSAKVVSPDEF